MIGRLQGVLLEKQPPHLLVDVGGVGYEVDAPMSTFYVLPSLGEKVMLFTHMVVRDDAHLLYGFARREERTMFRHLIKANGVGPKLALTILSGISTEELVQVLHDNDVNRLVSLPGIGKKTAERLIVELRDRLKDMAVGDGAGTLLPTLGAVPVSSEVGDAQSALIALGYKPQDAARMVKAVAVDGMGSEEIIRAALQSVAKAKA
ncbi:MAG: Holliday junction branch migration protein RuvA [Gammaproteobacteria bacterium]|nr:Holliday junction branch migration protein RuvA [Gammaproteobacteria bacterium]